jgi:hypothetical protein
MAIHMVTRVGGEEFRVTLSRDDAGNYVADGARLPRGEHAGGVEVPTVRVIDMVKERAFRSLLDSLQRLAGEQRNLPHDDPDTPTAA